MAFAWFINFAGGLLALIATLALFAAGLRGPGDKAFWLRVASRGFVASGLILAGADMFGLTASGTFFGGFLLILFGSGLNADGTDQGQADTAPAAKRSGH